MMQQLLDNPFLLLFFGVMVPMIVYSLWGDRHPHFAGREVDDGCCGHAPPNAKERTLI